MRSSGTSPSNQRRAVDGLGEVQRDGGRRRQPVVGVDAAVHRLDADVVGGEPVQRHLGPQRERVADLRVAAGQLRVDVEDPHARPGSQHAVAPGRQIAGAGGSPRPTSAFEASRGGRVQLLHVVAHHPRGERPSGRAISSVWRTICTHRVGHALAVAVVEARRDALLDQLVQRVRLEVVAAVVVADAVGRRDRPAVLAVVPLVPPAVEDGEVQRAVERGLHARRAARLERAQRVVQPDVHAPVEVARHRDVVVGQEGDAVAHRRVVGEAHHLLDELLAAVVGGVALAGDHDLHRAVRMQQQWRAACRGRAASASAACRTGRAGRSRWSARPGRRRSPSSPARPRWRRARATRRAAGGGSPRPAARAAVVSHLPQLGVLDLLDRLPAATLRDSVARRPRARRSRGSRGPSRSARARRW